jgi:hypothetical protein
MIRFGYAAYCYFCRRFTDHADNAGCKTCGR